MALSTDSSLGSADPTRLEVEQYLDCRNEPFQADVLAIWDDIKKRFPTLAKIAQDIFYVCASSTASESKFSMARKVVNPWRSTLGHKSLCLKSWYVMPELSGFKLLGQ